MEKDKRTLGESAVWGCLFVGLLPFVTVILLPVGLFVAWMRAEVEVRE